MSPHFGTAPFFTLVDLDTMNIEAVRNPNCHSQHGSCHHVPMLKAHSVDAVVCETIGRRALGSLRDAGIEVLSSPAGTVGWVIAAVSAGHTHPMPAHVACGGGDGHGQHCHSHE
jgi:predicted Fe-Mo cluster-binding NifX family protein